MTIYRIHPDRFAYRMFTISSREVLDKLGEAYPFHIDPSPKSYVRVWKALEIEFYDASDNRSATASPDVMVESGRLFLNEKAYEALQGMLEPCGEFLPVSYEGHRGHLFNVLALADTVDGVNLKHSLKDEYGDLQALTFYEEKVKDMPLFRSGFDDYMGLFCTQSFKDTIERAALHGLTFSPDLSNIFPPDPAAQQPPSH